MSRLIHVAQDLVSELKRRKVFRVAGVYAVVAFVVVQVADIVFPALHLPAWTVTLVVALAILGFPIALVLAWALEVTPDGVKRTEPAPTRAPSANTGGRDSRRIAIGLVVGFFLAVAGLGAYGWISSSESGAAEEGSLDPHRVAVFPFTVRGAEGLDHLGEGMVELLSLSLDGAGPLRTADRNAVLSRVATEGMTSGMGPTEARGVATGFNAGRYILGSIMRVGDDIHLSATWYRTDGEQLGSAQATAQGEHEIQAAIDVLARHAITALAGEGATQREQLAGLTTSSSEALKAYLEGQAALRTWDIERAVAGFQVAVEEDPDFALAHFRLSIAAGFNYQVRLTIDAARRAADLSANLPLRDQHLIRAQLAFVEGRPDDAERLTRQILNEHPDDLDAWYVLGETLFHFNSVRGRSPLEARAPLERVLELGPTASEARFHLVQLVVIERDREVLEALTAEPERYDLVRGTEARYRRIHAYLTDDELPDVANGEGWATTIGTAWILVDLGEFQDAEESLHPFTGANRAPDTRVRTHGSIARIRAIQGQMGAAREALSAIAPLDSVAYHHMPAHVGIVYLPFLPDDDVLREERSREISRLTDLDVADEPDSELPYDHDDDRRLTQEVDRIYRLGLLRAVEGDTIGALEAVAMLDGMEASELLPTQTHDYARAIEAEIARRAGRTHEALRLLEAVEPRGHPSYLVDYTAARERYLRAELLAESGRHAEALAWYETLSIGWGYEDLYFAPAHLGRARALEALDRPEEAAEAYERFLEFWWDADPELQPMVREAQARLEQHPGAGDRDATR